ncbi:MAG: AtpZ/AtpI family protein [Anaerolineales bacterium]|nr:AtpZ/AtpI family protein [Anaerolineales bacterium]
MPRKDDAGFWAGLWREALLATTLGWELAIPIFGGVLIGYGLDRWLGEGHTFTIGLLLAGVFVSYYNLWRFIKRLDRKSNPEENQPEEEGEAQAWNGEEGNKEG